MRSLAQFTASTSTTEANSHMKFFSNPEKAADQKLAETRNARDKLAGRLAQAQGAVTESNAALQQLAVQGADDAALAAGEAKLHEVERRVTTLTAGLAEIESLLAALETERAEMQDKKTRTATNAATVALADELVEAGLAYDASTAALAEVAGRAVAVSYEATGLHIFSQSSRTEVAAATEVVSMLLREHGRAVLNGSAKAAMPKPEPVPAKPVPVVREPLTQVFATKPLKWLDQDGKQRSSGKCVDVELPGKAAARALAIGAALPINHPERKKNLGQWPGNYSLASCFDLDAPDAAPPQHDPVVHSAFQPIDRGKPFTLKIAAS
jgi:hypothetical protein